LVFLSAASRRSKRAAGSLLCIDVHSAWTGIKWRGLAVKEKLVVGPGMARGRAICSMRRENAAALAWGKKRGKGTRENRDDGRRKRNTAIPGNPGGSWAVRFHVLRRKKELVDRPFSAMAWGDEMRFNRPRALDFGTTAASGLTGGVRRFAECSRAQPHNGLEHQIPAYAVDEKSVFVVAGAGILNILERNQRNLLFAAEPQPSAPIDSISSVSVRFPSSRRNGACVKPDRFYVFARGLRGRQLRRNRDPSSSRDHCAHGFRKKQKRSASTLRFTLFKMLHDPAFPFAE